jgi:hypothetical protein
MVLNRMTLSYFILSEVRLSRKTRKPPNRRIPTRIICDHYCREFAQKL